MANPAKSDDIVLLDASAMTAAKPQGPHCATCPNFYDSSTEPQRAARIKIGGVHRGECRLQPAVVNKEPDNVCGQHPELQARAMIAAFGPVMDRLADAMAETMTRPAGAKR